MRRRDDRGDLGLLLRQLCVRDEHAPNLALLRYRRDGGETGGVALQDGSVPLGKDWFERGLRLERGHRER